MSTANLISPESPVVEPGTELTVEERVANGMAFLDEHVPGWHDRICLDLLDIEDCTWCVLGQVFDGYHPAKSLGITEEQVVNFGLDSMFGWADERYKDEYPELTAAWKSALAAKGTR